MYSNKLIELNVCVLQVKKSSQMDGKDERKTIVRSGRIGTHLECLQSSEDTTERGASSKNIDLSELICGAKRLEQCG